MGYNEAFTICLPCKVDKTKYVPLYILFFMKIYSRAINLLHNYCIVRRSLLNIDIFILSSFVIIFF